VTASAALRRPHALAAALACMLVITFATGDAASGQQARSAGAHEAAAVDRALARWWPAGASGTVLVAPRYGSATCRGFGLADRRARIPAGCDTVYDLMSMTKQFTAAAVLKLAQQRRLELDDPIARFFGPVPGDKRAITVRQLLGHESGLPESLGDDYAPLTCERLVERALRVRLIARPGRVFRYSNVGYSLLAAIVEQASGTSYERFLARELFGPVGMTRTGYVLPRWQRGQVAVEYDSGGRSQGRPYQHPWAADGPYWNLRGNGGMLSSAHDVLRWHRALRGERVLGRAAKRELFKARAPLGLPGYEQFREAYGWTIGPFGGGRLATHSGGNGWSYGVIARTLDDGGLVFWISNESVRRGRWNLAQDARALTLALTRAASRPSSTGRDSATSVDSRRRSLERCSRTKPLCAARSPYEPPIRPRKPTSP
jgi:CubicO group peptidase (beta-lactamase class C family)